MPRWVKILISVAVLAGVAALLISSLAGVEHGPGRHAPPVQHGP